MERNTRIIVVDDQQDLCDQLAKLLLRSGRKNETLSLVQQMRAKLLGNTSESDDDSDGALEETGYIVDTANQGETAFEMVKKSNMSEAPYALAFIDMRMPPGWDGLKTAKSIREIDKEIEIVIMTAYADHDQKQIAETVGSPEKLLYIKKPFQAEEIYQLALSLTSKWSLESAEKNRRKWLEILLKAICKLKSYSLNENELVYQSTLKSLIEFTEAKSGFILKKYDFAWKIETISGMEKTDVEKFIAEGEIKLDECTTIKHRGNKYLLPMKKGGFFVIAVVQDEKTHPDPEWYKLLCLYIMAVVEELSWRDIIKIQFQNNGADAITQISNSIRPLAEEIAKAAEKDGSGKLQDIILAAKKIVDLLR